MATPGEEEEEGTRPCSPKGDGDEVGVGPRDWRLLLWLGLPPP